MLPTEGFAEAIAFLRLYDLGALMVANALSSHLAVKASNRIRWEEFPGLQFYMLEKRIEIFRHTQAPVEAVATLTFASKDETTEFVDAAFPNCIIDEMVVSRMLSKHILDIVGRAADSVIVNGALLIDGTINRDKSLSLIRKFHNVKALRLMRVVRDEEVDEIGDFYSASGVRELQCYRSLYDKRPRKLATFF